MANMGNTSTLSLRSEESPGAGTGDTNIRIRKRYTMTKRAPVTVTQRQVEAARPCVDGYLKVCKAFHINPIDTERFSTFRRFTTYRKPAFGPDAPIDVRTLAPEYVTWVFNSIPHLQKIHIDLERQFTTRNLPKVRALEKQIVTLSRQIAKLRSQQDRISWFQSSHLLPELRRRS